MANFKKTVFTGRLLLCALLFYAANNASGQDQTQYLKSMNSLVPGTPEASGIMKAIDFPVTLFTGQPGINIPLCEVNGKSLSAPVSLSYIATSGIRINEMAGKTGLGWLLSAGGEITREVRGKPDEGCCGAIGLFNTTAAAFENYKSAIIYTTDGAMGTYGRAAAMGQLDLEPDLFYFSTPGGSGKFIYDVTTGTYICTQLEPYKIAFDMASKTWTMTGPDGNIYLFDQTVKTTSRQSCNYNAPVNSGDQITTSWKLTKIMNADKTDSITIEYDVNSYTYFSEGSSTKYQLSPGANTTPRAAQNCFNEDYISGREKIMKICSVRDTVTFQYGTSQREDLLWQQRAIENIIYSNGEPSAKAIFKLDYDYYNRPDVSGEYPIQNQGCNKISLRLRQITNFGNSVSNPDPLKWIFTYNPYPLPARLSYNQDFWGYYNQNPKTNTLVPKEVLHYENGVMLYSDGASRFADTNRMKAGILEKIQWPTGGTTTFDYESNTTAIPTPLAKPADLLSISNLIMEGSLEPYHDSTLTFTIDVPHNPEIGLTDGVLADISINPTTPNGWPENPTGDYVNGYPYFSLSKIAGAGPSYARNYWLDAVTTDHLPSGKYEMTVHKNDFNGNNPGGQPYEDDEGAMGTIGITYTVAYYIPDTSKFINYQLGGLRIRSITSQDQYSNVTNIKRYKYHDPVTDSSYGFFVGSTIHEHNDYLRKYYFSQTLQAWACDYYLFSAKHGNCIMPGYNALGAAVIYPKVIEYTMDGSNNYKTEYTYNYVAPVYNTGFPFTPPVLNEAKHGKLSSATAFKTINSTSYQNARSTEHVYNFNPYCQYNSPSQPLAKTIQGIKVAFAGYTEDMTNCGFDLSYANLYGTLCSRADLTSDTVVTYDLNNQYNGVKEWHDYAYGDYTQQPIVVRTGNSDGSVNIQKNYFAKDQPEHNPDIYTNASLPGDMVLKNRVSMPLATKQFKDNQLLSRQVTNAHFDFDGNKLLIDDMQQALFSNPLETDISVLEYDDAANPLSIKMRGDKYRKYIWDKTKSIPLATCVMSENVKFVFTSFEYPNEYSWNESSRVLSNPFSGKYAYDLSGGQIAVSFSQHPQPTIPVSDVAVYVWATAGNFTINNQTPENTGKTKGNYTLYTSRVANAYYINLKMLPGANFSLLVDQLVAIPAGSQFQGNVYDAGNRVTAIVNDQIMTSFFEYDNFGRLSSVKDEQGNIIKSSSYKYQGPQ